MTINLRTIVQVLVKVLAIFFLAQSVAAFAPWVYLISFGIEDPFLQYATNAAGISAVANLVMFVALTGFSSGIARWIAPGDTGEIAESREVLLETGLRLVATVFLLFGTVGGITLFVGWYLQTGSSYVAEVWYPEAKIRAAMIRGCTCVAVGVALLATSAKIARYLSRSNPG